MKIFTNDYLLGLIEATQILYESSLDDDLNITWEIDRRGVNRLVIAKFCTEIITKTIVNDSMTQDGVEDESVYDSDYFVICEHEKEAKFCKYIIDILERVSIINLNN